jgi:hypothetical protein
MSSSLFFFGLKIQSKAESRVSLSHILHDYPLSLSFTSISALGSRWVSSISLIFLRILQNPQEHFAFLQCTFVLFCASEQRLCFNGLSGETKFEALLVGGVVADENGHFWWWEL